VLEQGRASASQGRRSARSRRPPPPATAAAAPARPRQVSSKGPGPDARPVCFCLSNPADKAEATFADVWRWSGGRAVYASGTAFPGVAVDADGGAVELAEPPSWALAGPGGGGGGGGGGEGGDGGPVDAAAAARAGRRLLRPAQGNNAHVFPGLALGCIATGATFVNDDMLLAAAQAIAGAARAVPPPRAPRRGGGGLGGRGGRTPQTGAVRVGSGAPSSLTPPAPPAPPRPPRHGDGRGAGRGVRAAADWPAARHDGGRRERGRSGGLWGRPEHSHRRQRKVGGGRRAAGLGSRRSPPPALPRRGGLALTVTPPFPLPPPQVPPCAARGAGGGGQARRRRRRQRRRGGGARVRQAAAVQRSVCLRPLPLACPPLLWPGATAHNTADDGDLPYSEGPNRPWEGGRSSRSVWRVRSRSRGPGSGARGVACAGKDAQQYTGLVVGGPADGW
jgi:hypothetical protein